MLHLSWLYPYGSYVLFLVACLQKFAPIIFPLGGIDDVLNFPVIGTIVWPIVLWTNSFMNQCSTFIGFNRKPKKHLTFEKRVYAAYAMTGGSFPGWKHFSIDLNAGWLLWPKAWIDIKLHLQDGVSINWGIPTSWLVYKGKSQSTLW